MRSAKITAARLGFAQIACGVAAAALLLPIKNVLADDERGDGPGIVSVAFGAGLNTAQPGNPANHHVLPATIRVSQGDVVNFVVSGLHVIRVYGNGVRLRDVKLQIPDECEVNPLPPATFPPQCSFGVTGPVPIIPAAAGQAVFYQGINPTVAPNPAPPAFATASNAVNRVEAVQFQTPGRYLVICAVLPHFNDGMTAIVEVRPRGGNGGGNGHNHD
jgi:plastocyanin